MRKKILFIAISIFIFGVMPNVKATGFLSEMPNGSYIIGEKLYTRSPLDDYKGVLKTEYIMKASKTINEDDIDSMIIYYKNPRGNLTNALTGENVDVTESELMSKIEYYNDKKLPTLSLDYATDSVTSSTDNIKYTLTIRDTTEDSELTNITNWDIYGAKEWNGTIYNFASDVSPKDTSEQDLKLLKSDINNDTHDYEVTLKKGDYYCYVAYPYILNGDDKLYLTPLDEAVIYSGAKVVQNINSNQIELSVTGIDDYKIKSALLYASRNVKTKGSHIETKDIINLVKNSDENVNKIDNKFTYILNLIAEQKSLSWGNDAEMYNWYIADIYENLEETPSSTKITLGDLGNSEKAKNSYRADLVITSPNILNGREIVIKAESNVEGIVYQKQLTSPKETEMNLFDMVSFMSSLLGEIEDTDYTELENLLS